MSFMLLLALAVGGVWGWAMVGMRPLIRRGLPILAVLLGGVLFRQSVREAGVQAVQAGTLTTTGLAGVMLILLGLMALLALVMIYLSVALGRAQQHTRRRK
jgi:hypothetical protein